METSIILLLLLLISGWCVQKGGGLISAVNKAMQKRPEQLLLIISVALISAAVLMLFYPAQCHSHTGEKLWLVLLGGVLFEMGAALNRGCFFGSLTRLCRGDMHILFTLCGVLTVSVLIPPQHHADTTPELSSPQYRFI